jgi:hypothetical protein
MFQCKNKNPTLSHLTVQGCQILYFHTKTSIWYILEGLEMENVGLFHSHLVFILVAVWYFCGHLVYFSRFGWLCQEKSGNIQGFKPATRRATTVLSGHGI